MNNNHKTVYKMSLEEIQKITEILAKGACKVSEIKDEAIHTCNWSAVAADHGMEIYKVCCECNAVVHMHSFRH